MQTAEVVIATLGIPLEYEVCDELAPGGESVALVRSLARDGAKRVMLVGHEPDVSMLTSYPLPDWSRGFDKSMVVALSVDRDACAQGTPTLRSLKAGS